MTFKVPTLRNVAETGPWFHDGKVTSLNEAVRLMGEYQLGRKFSAEEISSIASFLQALTGDLPQPYIQPQESAGVSQQPLADKHLHRMNGHSAQANSQRGE